MAITDSLLARSTRIVSSQLCRKLPSMPDTSIAFTIMRVSRKGTCAGGSSRTVSVRSLQQVLQLLCLAPPVP